MCIAAIRMMYLRPRATGIPAIASNTNEIPFEADSHADTTCLGGGALKIMDYNTPVRVQGYDPSLGAREYETISGGVGLCSSPYSSAVSPDISSGDSYATLGSPFAVPNAAQSSWGYGK